MKDKKTEEGPVLNIEIVLLKIAELSENKHKLWRNRIAKALSNGKTVTPEMLKPYLIELIVKGFVLKEKDENKKSQCTICVPEIVLTGKGKKEIERLKALKTSCQN